MKKNKLILIGIVLLIIVLIGWLIIKLAERASTIYVSSIKGKVVDAETGKPMKGVNVRVRWITGYADPGGGHGGTFKIYASKTDENGEFILPEVKKLKIPIIEVYQGEQILIYEHGYVHQTIGRDARQEKQIKYHEIALKPITNDEEYNKNLEGIHYSLSIGYFDYDFQFIVDDYKIFLKNYPNSHFTSNNYRNLAGLYDIGMKDYESALKVNEEFIKKYPNSPIINFVREDVQRLKKLLKDSSEKGGNANEK